MVKEIAPDLLALLRGPALRPAARSIDDPLRFPRYAPQALEPGHSHPRTEIAVHAIVARSAEGQEILGLVAATLDPRHDMVLVQVFPIPAQRAKVQSHERSPSSPA
jgi:hypothetical protein